MMPRLSCSQRTTAPAMATEPCQAARTGVEPGRATQQTHKRPRFQYLQRIKGRLVPAQFVRHRGQEAVVGHHGLRRKERASVEHTCTPSACPPLGYLRSGVPEEETAGPISGKGKDKWTKGHLERRRLTTPEPAHVFFACPSWKHICPTRAADWSPRHCRHRNLSVTSDHRSRQSAMRRWTQLTPDIGMPERAPDF